MALIQGINVILHEKHADGIDPFGNPTFYYNDITVDNVLVEPITQQEMLASTELSGTKTAYRLCIPKGDTHKWENNDVTFWDTRFHVYTNTIEYIDANVPLEWNKKVLVEAYDL